jgi:hypothetical protein
VVRRRITWEVNEDGSAHIPDPVVISADGTRKMTWEQFLEYAERTLDKQDGPTSQTFEQINDRD